MMSLQPYLPPVSGDAGSVFALLQVLADPEKARAALKLMVEERKKDRGGVRETAQGNRG